MTLLATQSSSSVDEYAQTYLAGNPLASSREESRAGAPGRSYLFSSADGTTRYALLLLREEGRLYGLYTQGAAPLFERHYPVLEEMTRSFTLERLAAYPVRRDADFGFSVRIPPSWRETRRFSGKGNLMLQYSSPALGADRNRQTVHASLTLTVEPLPQGSTSESYYDTTRKNLGENFEVLRHEPWQGGYADVMRTETPLASSNLKRFLRVDGRRGYSLAFESRDDLYPRVSRWYDLIASSLKTGDELEKQ